LKGRGMADLDKPNILVIWGDDIGITNLSCYSDGLMGYRRRPSTRHWEKLEAAMTAHR
jgi:arylsulfatase A-like enzyme